MIGETKSEPPAVAGGLDDFRLLIDDCRLAVAVDGSKTHDSDASRNRRFDLVIAAHP
jgi:hypothetical protein